MPETFLDVLEREDGDCSPKDGENVGPPTGQTGELMFATGIECSNPKVGGVRRDLLEETDHYRRYAEDLALVRELGLRYLRYGLPYYRVNPARGVYDWSFADAAMAEIRRLEIVPILDLLHFGVPDWLGDLQNPELPLRFAEYAEAVAQRYPWVRFFTPVNEIYVCAKASGHEGEWNELRFLALDLLYSHEPSAGVGRYTVDWGLTREEYDWFMTPRQTGYQVMGVDYYGRNESMILPNGDRLSGEDLVGWYGITKAYYNRYRRPLMHTETNVLDADAAPQWLWKQWGNILRMRNDGIPVLGFTWYSLVDQVDWDTKLVERNGRVNPAASTTWTGSPVPWPRPTGSSLGSTAASPSCPTATCSPSPTARPPLPSTCEYGSGGRPELPSHVRGGSHPFGAPETASNPIRHGGESRNSNLPRHAPNYGATVGPNTVR